MRALGKRIKHRIKYMNSTSEIRMRAKGMGKGKGTRNKNHIEHNTQELSFAFGT